MSRNVKPVANAFKLLRIVVNNFGYFEKNLPQLAWVMMYYEALIRQGRILYDDWTNPKDAILDVKELTEEQSNLLYDAWGITVSNHQEFNDPIYGPTIGHKLNKTLDDWITLFSDPTYQYHELHKGKRDTIEYLLTHYGTGYHWVTDEGVDYIAHTGPSGINQARYCGYTQAGKQVPDWLLEKIKPLIMVEGAPQYVKTGIRNAKLLATGWKRDILTGKINSPKTKKASPTLKYLESREKQLAAKGILPTPAIPRKQEFFEMCQYSNLFVITKRAHPSYQQAAAKLSAQILLDPKGKHYKTNAPIARACLKRLGYSKTPLKALAKDH